MYLIYSAGLAIALLLAMPYWLVKAASRGKYRSGLKERFGIVPARLQPTKPNESCIWIHAVSVGEVLAVSGIIKALQSKLSEKSWRIAISTTTMTGQKLAREKFGEENVFYFPLDFAFAMRPYFRALRPRLVILAETEFWPNFLRSGKASGARIAVVNARISDRSFPRYQRFANLFRRVLRDVDSFLAQSELDKARLIAIGAETARVQVSGNLKFDISVPQQSDLLKRLRAALTPDTPVIVCGSTVEGEEPMLVEAFKSVLEKIPQALLILAPRHPERFANVAKYISVSGLRFWRRSEWHNAPLGGGIFLLDSIGELASLYAVATAAFVGGSLVPRGGHNILEPAQFGKPIFVGPYMENFRDIVHIFSDADAVHVINPQELPLEFVSMLDAKWYAMGERGLQVFRDHSGATQKTLDALEVLMWMPSTLKKRYEQVQQ